jgi:ABC-2 type transport system permease protein
MGTREFTLVFYKNFIGQIRQVRRNLMLFLVPILIFVFISIFFSLNKVEESFMKSLSIGVIDKDKTMYSDVLINSFEENDSFTNFINVSIGDENKLTNEFYDNKYDALLTIPAGFIENLMYFDYDPINVMINYKNPITAMLLKNAMIGYEKYITSVEVGVSTLYNKMYNLGFSNEEINSYNNLISTKLIFMALNRNKFFKSNEIVNVPAVSSIKYFFLSIIIMFLMYISVFAAINLIKEREDRCFERLKLSRISIYNYIIGKAISTTTFIFIIVAIWYILFVFFTDYSFSNNIIYQGFFMFENILFDVAVAILVSSLFEKEEAVVLFSNVFVFINGIIGGSIVPIHYMPTVIQKIAIVSPNYWMLKGFLYIDSNYRIYDCIYIALAIGIISIIMVVVSGHRYKKIW